MGRTLQTEEAAKDAEVRAYAVCPVGKLAWLEQSGAEKTMGISSDVRWARPG